MPNLCRCQMLEKYTHGKYTVTLDADNYRYIIKPLRNDKTLSIANALYAIKLSTHCSYKAIADFLGLKNANQVFKIIYVKSKRDIYVEASKFLAIDVDNECAYLYDKNHQPAIVVPPHIGPTLINNESALQTVTELVPASVTSRVQIKDVYDRQLVLTVKPTGGYILGIGDVNLCSPNATYQATGNKTALNKLLKQIHFVSTDAKSGKIEITVDDKAGKVNSVSKTEVKLSITAAAKVSIPEVTVPETLAAKLNEYAKVDPAISVKDADGKIMELRIAPFGCEIAGFKSFLFPIKEGQTRSSGGVPENINAEIAKLEVRPVKANAFIGVELIYNNNKTKIRKNIALDVTIPEEGDTEEEVVDAAPVAQTPKETDKAVAQSVPTEVVIASNSVKGNSGDKVALGIEFTGDASSSITASLACVGCSITDLATGSDIASGKTRNLIGTLEEVNKKLSTANIALTTGTGKVTLNFNDKSYVIEVEGVAPATETESEAKA